MTTPATVRDAVAKRAIERAGNPSRALAEAAEDGRLKMAPVLAAIGIDANNPVHQAALLIANRYGLDPLLKHVVVIQGKGAYITRDGLLAVAHNSGQFDGIEITDVGETDTHYTAKASVWRKDMGRPFVYPGRYRKGQGNKEYGPEMAIKCAEVMALRRAFNVAAPVLEERSDIDDDDVQTFTPTPTPPAAEPSDDEPVQAELIDEDGQPA